MTMQTPAAPDAAPSDAAVGDCAAADVGSAADQADAAVDAGEVEIANFPPDTLMQTIFALLAPLFMGTTTDEGLARLAAIETLASYHMRNQAELVCIAQIIAFGMAAMDTLRVSMLPGLSIPMKLRLRGCANGLSRSAQQNVGALAKGRQDALERQLAAEQHAARHAGVSHTGMQRMGMPHMGAGPMGAPVAVADDPFPEAKVRASVQQTRAFLDDIKARMLTVAPDAADAAPAAAPHGGTAGPVAVRTDIAVPAAPAGIGPSAPAGPVQPAAALASAPPLAAQAGPASGLTRQQINDLIWANAMSGVAGEGDPIIARSMSQSDRVWAETLASAARQLAASTRGPATAKLAVVTPPKRF